MRTGDSSPELACSVQSRGSVLALALGGPLAFGDLPGGGHMQQSSQLIAGELDTTDDRTDGLRLDVAGFGQLRLGPPNHTQPLHQGDSRRAFVSAHGVDMYTFTCRGASVNAVDDKTGIHSEPPLTVGDVAPAKSLSPEERERVVVAIENLRGKYPSQSALALELGVKQQTIGAVLRRHQPPGAKLARNVARKLRITFDELVAGTPPRAPRAELNRELPGWIEAAEEVLAKGWQRRFAVLGAANLPVSLRPERVTAPFVLDLAKLFLEHASTEQRRAAETAEAKEDLERADARRT